MRMPRIAGVAGGMGTSLLAEALRAHDAGVYDDGPVDILVCRTTVNDLGAVHQAVARAPYPPVLAVVADIPASLPSAVRARIRMVAPHVQAAVAVPFVMEWRAMDNPYAAAAQVLRPEVNLPKGIRAFAAAVRKLAKSVEPLLLDPRGTESRISPHTNPNLDSSHQALSRTRTS